MNCGHVVDPVTEHNRKLQAQGLVGVVNVPQMTKGVADLPTLAACSATKAKRHSLINADCGLKGRRAKSVMFKNPSEENFPCREYGGTF
jgi:hypothetical protein